MSLPAISIVMLCLVVLVVAWVVMNLLKQNGRLLLRIEALEQQKAAAAQPRSSAPAGLPVGSPAPAFELPDLAGGVKKLADFRGRRVLLTFFNPGCGFCTRMAPDLAALPIDPADGRPTPLVVSAGPEEANRRMVQEHAIGGPVLLQKGNEVLSLFKATGTPTGLIIDEHGRIETELAVGATAVLALAALPPKKQTCGSAATRGDKKAYQGNRSLADSKIKRGGLAAGTPAPDFCLPRVEGGELSLDAYRGRRVLLVFSAPDCGPCNELAPKLARLSGKQRHVDIVMVSRGDPDANRQKVAEHRLKFPVVLQRQWEISKLYGMFATPIAYLIDENGIIVRDVAVGAEPILALLSAAQDLPHPGAASSGRKEASALTH